MSTAGTGPTDPLRDELARIWSRLLARNAVGPADDFFALGGTSLLAIELCLEIRSRLACELEPSTLYAHPTLAELAEIVRAEERRAGSPVLLFHRDGARPAVACVPGNMTSPRVALRGLFEGLGADQPIVAFQDRRGMPSDVRAVASLYLDEWLRLKPDGPHVLIGFCWGAAIAFEMAVRLRGRGESVALLALVEPARLYPPGWLSVARVVVPAYLARIVRRGGEYGSELAALDREGRRLLLRQKRKMLRNSIALRLWRPAQLAGTAEVYLTGSSLESHDRERMVWRRLFSTPPRVYTLEGDHALLTGSDGAAVDHQLLAGLGRRLRAQLDAVDAGSR